MASINESADVKVNINGQEAVDELKRIRQETEKVNKALAETNDKEEIQKLRKQLKTLEGDMRKVRSSAQSIDAAMQHLDTKHAKELKQLVRDIKGQLESGFIKRGTQEWDDYVKKLKLAKEELKHIYDEQVFITRLEPPKNFFEKITQGATKIWSAFDMGVRIVEAVYDKISKYIDALSAKQESSANLKALTGLDDQSIQWLTEQAERLSTQMDETGRPADHEQTVPHRAPHGPPPPTALRKGHARRTAPAQAMVRPQALRQRHATQGRHGTPTG